MSDASEQPSDGVTLLAEDLESKWGFSDGDLIFDWLPDDDLDKLCDFSHTVLVDLVRTHLMPVVTAAGHSVELEVIGTIHNPVRARSINGQEVDHYADHRSILRGLGVSLSAAEIWASLARVKEAAAR